MCPVVSGSWRKRVRFRLSFGVNRALRAVMIDAALRTMIDEVLPRAGKMSKTPVEPAPGKRHLSVRKKIESIDPHMRAPSSSLFDQTALAERAERLVQAARAAGADAADAVAR